MGRLAVVVVGPATELGEHALSNTQLAPHHALVDVHVVALERVHEGLGQVCCSPGCRPAVIGARPSSWA
jgi:hypothetical protein